MGFEVQVDTFSGPLDLMLHLIKENKLNLFDLDISILVDQYFAYIKHFNDLHLEVASEYLVELAMLIEYKSKKLLPKNDEELEDEYEEDPKERLVRRLLEYQQFKEISSEFEDYYKSRSLNYGKPISSEVESWIKNSQDSMTEGSPYDLIKAMNKVLRRLQLNEPLQTKVTKKELSMEDRKFSIISRLASLPRTFNFDILLETRDRDTVIVTFLAILDLIRTHILTFTVDNEENIWFTRGNS